MKTNVNRSPVAILTTAIRPSSALKGLTIDLMNKTESEGGFDEVREFAPNSFVFLATSSSYNPPSLDPSWARALDGDD